MFSRKSVNIAKIGSDRITLLTTLFSNFGKRGTEKEECDNGELNFKLSHYLEKPIKGEIIDFKAHSKVFALIGPMVEEAEGRLRLQLGEVYFHRLNILLNDALKVDSEGVISSKYLLP